MRLLFFIYNYAHLSTAQNISRELKDKNSKYQIDFLSYGGYSSFDIDHNSNPYGNVFYLPQKHGKSNYFLDSFTLFTNIRIIEKFIKILLLRNKYDVLIMTQYDKGLIEALTFKICNNLGILTILLQEGLVIREEIKNIGLSKHFEFSNKKKFSVFRKLFSLIRNMGYFKTILFIVNKFVYRNLIAKEFGFNGSDFIASFSMYYKKILISQGFPSEKIECVGLARFDELEIYQRNNNIKYPDFNTIEQTTILFPQTLGLKDGNYYYNTTSELELLNNIKKQLRDVKVLYRLRQGEIIEDYSQLISNFPEIEFIYGNSINPYLSIIQCHIIISTASTMLLESLKLKRFGILYERNGNDYYRYVQSGSCLMCTDDKSAIESIKAIINSSIVRSNLSVNAEKFVFDRAMMDGLATSRTCSFIENCVNFKRKIDR